MFGLSLFEIVLLAVLALLVLERDLPTIAGRLGRALAERLR